MNATRKFKINGLGITDKEFNGMPFGRQIEYLKKIEEFKQRATVTHVSQKRRTHNAAWKEFKNLFKPLEWFTIYNDNPDCRDDVFAVWYTMQPS